MTEKTSQEPILKSPTGVENRWSNTPEEGRIIHIVGTMNPQWCWRSYSKTRKFLTRTSTACRLHNKHFHALYREKHTTVLLDTAEMSLRKRLIKYIVNTPTISAMTATCQTKVGDSPTQTLKKTCLSSLGKNPRLGRYHNSTPQFSANRMSD